MQELLDKALRLHWFAPKHPAVAKVVAWDELMTKAAQLLLNLENCPQVNHRFNVADEFVANMDAPHKTWVAPAVSQTVYDKDLVALHMQGS